MMRQARYFGITGWLATTLWLAASCNQSSFDDGFDELPPPPSYVGEDEWGNRDITCSSSTDCGSSESCIDNVCQMQRCTEGPYNSVAPLGDSLTLATEREIIAADGDSNDGAYWIDGYVADNQQVTHASSASWNFGSRRVLDIAGGDFYGSRPERFVAALEGSTELHIRRDGHNERIDLGFQPVAVAAGDTDRDGRDDIIALSGDGRFALCKAAEQSCRSWSWNGDVEGVDVASADVDGDGYAEAIFLIRNGGETQLLTWHPHHEETGQDEFAGIKPGSGSTDHDFKAIAAGDITGDGVAEVVAIHDRTWPADDRMKIYRYVSGNLSRVGDESLETKDSKHVATGDLNMSGQEELLILRDDRRVDVYRGHDDGSASLLYDAQLSVTSNAARIATTDIIGDSPVIARVSGPELIPGPVVPMLAAEFPPYDAAHSGGGGVPGAGGGAVSNLFLGNTESTSETFDDSVHVRAGVAVGGEANFFGVLGASAKVRVQRQIEYTESVTTTQVIGNRYFVLPEPDRFGASYGVVMLSAGCFHGYEYRVHDPESRIASDVDGSTVFGVVPVDGQVTLWSTNRYNALAERLDYLPTIEVSTEIGNPDSYPQTPQRTDGTPIPPEHMVFPEPPQYLVAETGRTGWWLTTTESESQSVSMTTEVGVLTSLSAGVTVDADLTAGEGQAYSVTLGEEVIFGGAVPAIEDDPSTPESEYEKFSFSFAPYVYRETYVGPDGEEAGYYMMNFTVGSR